MNNYELPNELSINLNSSTPRTEVEQSILKAFKIVAVYVDKDELIKALIYDRNQCEKRISDATPKWISVEEKLPKDEENVLVTIKDDSADSPIYYTSVGWYYKGIWVVENEVSHQVIAWMPFPEPYREH
ncbi:MAG: DUF551 domain-containing protein [Acetivibrio ethanolgignens]